MDLSPSLDNFLLDELKNDSLVIPKNMAGVKYLEKAQKIILSPSIDHESYQMKPYLNTNQNQQYVSKILNHEYRSACIVASAGDTVFEAVRNGIDSVDVVDISDLQLLIFKLRFACIMSLNNSEFESFLLDSGNKDILSYSLYSSLINPNIKEEDIHNFWEFFLKLNPPKDILNYYLKGGIERTDIDNIRSMLPYVKKRGAYMNLREKLHIAKIELFLADIINFLLENPERKYDYIDFSNILLFIYQYDCDCSLEKYTSYLEKIKIIFDNNLNINGTFVIDYMFGVDEKSLEHTSILLGKEQQEIQEFYRFTYHQLCELFDLKYMSLKRAAETFIFDGANDMLLYTRKM